MGMQRRDERIGSLYLQREKYQDYPLFQREAVWSPTMNQTFIDSILREMYIHPLLVHERRTPAGATFFDVIDGQQRLRAIFDFMDGKFRTMTASEYRKVEPGPYKPVEPRKYYIQLSPSAKNIFDDYTLHFYVLDNLDDPTVGMTFRRIQNQVPLTPGEKLWVYTSKAAHLAAELMKNPVWTQWYMGDTHRKQPFAGSLYVIYLELTNSYPNMTFPRLLDLAAGLKDAELTEEKQQQMAERLDVVLYVFSGTPFRYKEQLIPMYQAVLFLEEEGYTFTQSMKGILSPWMAALAPALEQRRGFTDFFGQFVYSNKQQDFWKTHLASAHEYYQKGIAPPDPPAEP
jgi:hypothetical protein